jgi:hypothetical protein
MVKYRGNKENRINPLLNLAIIVKMMHSLVRECIVSYPDFPPQVSLTCVSGRLAAQAPAPGTPGQGKRTDFQKDPIQSPGSQDPCLSQGSVPRLLHLEAAIPHQSPEQQLPRVVLVVSAEDPESNYPTPSPDVETGQPFRASPAQTNLAQTHLLDHPLVAAERQRNPAPPSA